MQEMASEIPAMTPTIGEKLRCGVPLSKEEERELLTSVNDCFSPALWLDILLAAIPDDLRRDPKINQAIKCLTDWRNLMLKRAKRKVQRQPN